MKTRKIKKSAVIGITALTVGAMLLVSGCNGKNAGSNSKELTYWVYMNSDASSVMSNFGDTPLAKKLEENTGIHVTYQHPPVGQETEKFNIMVASDDLPDIIEYTWTYYPGGPSKALDDGTIISISDHKSKAPNLFKYLNENNDIMKLSQTDTGDVFAFPFIRGDKSLLTSKGIIIRQDWLDDLGLEMPETIDEWDAVLTAFKNQKGAAAPLSLPSDELINVSSFFSGAYGIAGSYYRDGDTIKYGPADPRFKDFLIKMNEWYSKKLLDQNFAVIDSKGIDSNILNGVSGATVGSMGRGIGKWMSGKVSEGYRLEGAPSPVLKKGDMPEFGFRQLQVPGSAFAAITTSCKNIDTAMEFLDYGYSEEGTMLYNFGIEGESYNMIDGYPTYTDNITHNEEGLSMTAAMALYTRSFDRGPFVQDKRYLEQYSSMPEQVRAWHTWEQTNADAHILPHLYIAQEDLNEYTNLNTSVKSYADEMLLKFIMGKESLDKYDSFVDELNQRGLQTVLRLKQEAYNRYLSRSEQNE